MNLTSYRKIIEGMPIAFLLLEKLEENSVEYIVLEMNKKMRSLIDSKLELVGENILISDFPLFDESLSVKLKELDLDPNNEILSYHPHCELLSKHHKIELTKLDKRLISLTIVEEKNANDDYFNEDRFRKLFENIEDILYQVDLSGKIVELSPSVNRYGYRRSELLGTSVYNMYYDINDREGLIKLLMEKGKVSDYELRLKSSNGEIITTSAASRLILDEQGKPIFIEGFLRDISKRKKAEESLAKSEEKYKALVDNAFEGIVILSLQGEILFINHAFLKMVAAENESQILGHNVFEFIDVDFHEKAYNDFLNVSTGKDSYIAEYTGKNVKGEKIVFESIGKLIKYGDDLADLVSVRDITERKKSNEEIVKLHEELNRTHTIQLRMIENIGDVIVIIDQEGINRYKSPNIEKWFGWLPEDVVGKPTWNNVHPDDVEDAKSFLADLASRPFSTGTTEVRYLCKDGTYNWIEATFKNLLDDPYIEGFLGNYHNIESRKLAEQAFAESQERFKALHNASFGGITIHDKGLIVECNQGLSEISGYSYDELIGMNGLLLISEDTRDFVIRRINEEFEHPYEAKGLRKNGEVYPLRLEARMIPYKGRMMRVVEFRDISDQKRYEHELILAKVKAEESIANIQSIIENTTDSIWSINSNYELSFFNRVFANDFFNTFGIELKNGDVVIDNLPLEMQVTWRERYSRVFKGERFNFEEQIEVPGTTIYIHVSVNPIISDGKVIGASFFGSDISERKRAEQELIAAKEKAEESDRLKTAFLANMSHEIRTPMNGILGFMKLLSEPNVSEKERKDYISIVNNSGQRLLDTINDIIEISKIDAGQASLNISSIDIADTLLYYQDFFEIQAKQKNLDFVISNDIPKEDSIIKTDKNKLNGILTNLLKNAIKFTSEGKIELSAKIEGDFIQISISDTGLGIPKDKLNLIFERFVQANLEITRPYEGSGLGLSIVKAYVNMLQGKIHVESEPGLGSKFIVELPNMTSLPKIISRPMANNNNTVRKDLSNSVILVAEDDDISYKYLETILKKEGFKLYRSTNGKETIANFEKNQDISLILMDLQMPEMDGFETSTKIRELNSEIPIIAQTAYALSGDRERALSAGCNDYIAKPINKHTLLKLISKHLE